MDAFLKEQSEVQLQRHKYIQESCANHPHLNVGAISHTTKRQILVVDKHRLLYCFIPKVLFKGNVFYFVWGYYTRYVIAVIITSFYTALFTPEGISKRFRHYYPLSMGLESFINHLNSLGSIQPVRQYMRYSAKPCTRTTGWREVILVKCLLAHRGDGRSHCK